MAETALLTAEEYRVLAAQIPTMVWRADTTGRRDYFNERWLAFTGHLLDRELGIGWLRGVHPEDRGRCRRVLETAFLKKEPFELEYRLRRYDGVHRWVLDRGAPWLRSDGSFAGYVGSAADITEHVERSTGDWRHVSGFLRMCAHCSRVQLSNGRWGSVAEYLFQELSVAVSHGLCPDCFQSHWKPEIDQLREHH